MLRHLLNQALIRLVGFLPMRVVYGFALILGLWLVACGSSLKHSANSQIFDRDLPQDAPLELKEQFTVKDLVISSPSASLGASLEASLRTLSSLPFASVPSLTPGSTRMKSRQLERAVTRSKKAGQWAFPTFQYPDRRGATHPIQIGEKLFFTIYYLGIAAGSVELEVLPLKVMNQRKVYHIRGMATHSALFGIFYRLHDMAETFMDYEGYFSHRFHLVQDESKQTRDSLQLNSAEKRQTYYWDQLHHKVKGDIEKKTLAPIQAFSQDSLSALYYLRTIPLPTGAVIHIPVVADGKEWDAICTVVRREEMDTPLGRISTVVIRPEMQYQGVLKRTGNSYLWLSDDDRRIPLRLEAKVKVGSVVARLNKVESSATEAHAADASDVKAMGEP